jgi:hypothetical protein
VGRRKRKVVSLKDATMCSMAWEVPGMKVLATVMITLALACIIFLFSWQYLIDPRFADSSIPKQLVGDLSRAVFGERCRGIYRINNRSDAIDYAKKVWKIEAMSWIATGDSKSFETVMNSESFRKAGVSDRVLDGTGWVASKGEGDSWDINYYFSDSPVISAYFTIEFSNCGRVTKIGETHFNKSVK